MEAQFALGKTGFEGRQKSLHLVALSLLGGITPPITPTNSQGITWRNKLRLGYTRTFLGK